MKSYQRLLMGRSRSGHPGSIAGMPLLCCGGQPSAVSYQPRAAVRMSETDVSQRLQVSGDRHQGFFLKPDAFTRTAIEQAEG